MSLYAEVHPPRPYNSSDPDLGNSTGWAANATEAAGLLPAGTTQPQPLSVAAAAGYRLPALPSIAAGRRVSTPTVPNAPRGQGAPESMKSGRADASLPVRYWRCCWLTPMFLCHSDAALLRRLQGPGRLRGEDPPPAEEIRLSQRPSPDALPLQLHHQVHNHNKCILLNFVPGFTEQNLHAGRLVCVCVVCFHSSLRV